MWVIESSSSSGNCGTVTSHVMVLIIFGSARAHLFNNYIKSRECDLGLADKPDMLCIEFGSPGLGIERDGWLYQQSG